VVLSRCGADAALALRTMGHRHIGKGLAGLAIGIVLAAGACTATMSNTGDDSDANHEAGTKCRGLYGTVPPSDGAYDATEFGCWVDKNGSSHSDPGDNCIPTCLPQAKKSLCSGLSGPQCERKINWYTADGARFGCMTRLLVTNEKNGKAVVVV